MTSLVVTLVRFLCGLRWELPSVLGTAQSRGSPGVHGASGTAHSHCCLVNGSVLLHLAHLQCHNLVRHALQRTPNPSPGVVWLPGDTSHDESCRHVVRFLCCLRWELPSVLGTAQSRGSPSRSWCQRHCTRIVAW